MAPNANYDDIFSTTLENRRGEFADDVSKMSALFYKLSEAGNIDPADGGRTLVEELEYAENANFKWLTGYDEAPVGSTNTFSAAEYAWKQAVCAIVWSGLDMIQNSGREQKINLVTARVKNAERTIKNKLAAAAYADGTGSGGLEPGGLQYLIPDDPTTSSLIGNINQNTETWWRSSVTDFSADSLGTASAATIRRALLTARLRTTRNGDMSDLAVLDNIFYTYLSEAANPLQVIQTAKLAELGYEAIKLAPGIEAICDGGKDGSCPASHAYLVNTKFLKWRPHSEYNLVPIGGNRTPINQWSGVKMLGVAGNFTCSNRSLQGVLIL
jgi:hypothetical protein